MTSSFKVDASSFGSLLISFDGKIAVGLSAVLSEVLFLWLLLVPTEDCSKTDYFLSFSLKKCTSL